jgi:O-acetylhomoserine/O-acetylserine sulfhydrylase-like pyridoxal-dependent enzyme
VNITWQQVTQGSIDELFGYLATYNYKHGNKIEKAFTLEALRMFYTRADKYMQNIIESKHALLKNKVSGCPFKQI